MQENAGQFRRFGLLRQILALIPAFAISSCESPEPTELPIVVAGCVSGSHLRGETWGAIETPIAWQADDMQCEGMRRPGNEGARLRFSGHVDNAGEEQRLAMILALPNLAEGSATSEQPTRVTLIEEDAGRFFSTRERDVCWTDIREQSPHINDSGRRMARQYLVSGLLYCVGPIPELNGGGSVTLGEIEFSGLLNWAKPD